MQPSTHGFVNGQDSNEQTMRQTIPMPTLNAGCFGGGSVFQAMIRPSPSLHGFMPDIAHGAMQAGSCNPMYGNIGVQPGFQCAAGSYGMPGANMGMAGFTQPYAQNQSMTVRAGGHLNSGMPLLNAPAYDNLTPKWSPKDYKEGGQAVKFGTFHGTHDKLKALLFLQQFDAAFAGGNFTESSKIRKAATFLKTNVLQWWTTLLNQVSSFKIVPLAEQIEKYCCGLPKGIKKYCMKTSLMNMAQLMENAEVADDLIKGKRDEDGFKIHRKEPQGKQFSAKGNVTSRLTIAAWRARSSLPVAVEVTWDLISIQRTDPFFRGSSCLEASFSNELLCLMYAMAIMRLINGVVDHSKKQSSLSVADRAETVGLPRMLVDIRHEVAHQELPSLSYLRLASKEAIDWLKVHYWEAQKQVLDNTHKHLQDKLQVFASSSDASENKMVGSRKRFLTLHAKKLVKLSGPAVNLLDGCKSDWARTSELEEAGTEHEKLNDLLFSGDAVDAEFQKCESALSRARKCLQAFCRSHHTTEGFGIEADAEESDDPVNTLSFDLSNTHQKIESALMENQSFSKAVWAVADSWKPCAIGMLPSKVHPRGVLPFPGILLPGVAKEDTAGHVAGNLSNEIGANVHAQKLSEAVASLDLVRIRDCFKSEESDIIHKRLKRDSEAPKLLETAEDLCPLSPLLLSTVSSKSLKVVPDCPQLSGKPKASLPAGGFLLLEGIYQRCGIDKLTAIRSSIQILK
ncbi:hypothetical protein L7F22_035106 [Adiantum nelumboides]|nr:hypothetical protein [Adiantum nelumboides]